MFPGKSKRLRDLVAGYQATSEIGSIKILDEYGKDILSSPKPSIPTSRFAGSHSDLIKKGLKGQEDSII